MNIDAAPHWIRKAPAADENMLRSAAIFNPIAPPEPEDAEEEMSVKPPRE